MHIKQYDCISKLTLITQKLKPENLKNCQSQSNESEKGIPMGYPPFLCLGMPSCLGLIGVVQLCILLWFFLGGVGKWSHPNVSSRGPSLIEWEYSASR